MAKLKEMDTEITAGHIEEFLRNIFVDSEGGGRSLEDKAPPGFVTWLPLRMEEEDYFIREYDEEVPHPMVLESDQHGAAYAVSMEALLRLRHWWKECGQFFEGKRPEEAVSVMIGDIEFVCSYLTEVRDRLVALRDRDLDEHLRERKMELLEAQEALVKKESSVAVTQACLDFAMTLTLSPTELLARQSDKSDTTPDHEE